MSRVAKHVLVRGLVQGVGFRWHTKQRARELGVVGWVKNLSDGRVEVRAEGAPAAVAEFVLWLERGPPGARVEDLEVNDAPLDGPERFEVRH